MAAITTTDEINPSSLIVRLQGDRIHVQHHFYAPSQPSVRPGRGVIEAFSRESAHRLRDYLVACDAEYRVFCTITYPYGDPAGQSPMHAKKHLRALFERIRRLWGSKRFSYESLCWWMEFTQRGMVHFHFLSTRYVDKSWLAMAWYQIVASENPYHLKAGTRVEGLRSRGDAVNYAAKYATKQMEYPVEGFERIGRWWGVYGQRSVVEADIYIKGGSKGLEQEELTGLYERLQAKMLDLCEQGQAKLISNMDEDFNIISFRVPQLTVRRMLRRFLIGLSYESKCLLYMDADDPLFWHGPYWEIV